MAKKTLLEIVQDILNDLDSDEANSINDSVEAQQVALTVRTVYEELMSNRNWPHTKKLLQLAASGNTNKPVYMKIPDDVNEIEEVRYDIRKEVANKKEFKTIVYKTPSEFLDFIYRRDSNSTNILTILDDSGVPLLIRNDVGPTYWTSFDDEWVVFDSYDASLESTLQSNKSQTSAYATPPWTHADNFVPDLPAEAFSLLFHEALSVCSINFKQMANQKAEQKASRQNRWLARKAWKAKGGIQYDDYGRKSKR